jgi:CHASE2 domain-containing sensor protein
MKYKFGHPPAAIKDILLVTIDNETLKNMPERWPYPRIYFAKVVENLKKAQAKVIGFDFVFFGKSNEEDDKTLTASLESNDKVVLASTVDEDQSLNFPFIDSLKHNIVSGIITKFQDPDGVTRENLTYLVSNQDPLKGFPAWEIQILKAAKRIIFSSLASDNYTVSFENNTGERWEIPIRPQIKSFMINFRAHTTDFNRLSFYQLFKGDYDPAQIKNKIVLVGMVSSLLGDIHNTPIGWMPGITLNANAFLTLYAHDFIRQVPQNIELFVLIIGIFLSGFFISIYRTKKAYLCIAAEIFLFFMVSYVLLVRGLLLNYFLFPFSVVVCPFLGKKLYLLLERQKQKNKI